MLEEIGEPVPSADGFDDGFVGSGELGEVPISGLHAPATSEPLPS